MSDFIELVFFFFKQKTAYEMRISDWSSDVGSSDLSYSFGYAALMVPDCAARDLYRRSSLFSCIGSRWISFRVPRSAACRPEVCIAPVGASLCGPRAIQDGREAKMTIMSLYTQSSL